MCFIKTPVILVALILQMNKKYGNFFLKVKGGVFLEGMFIFRVLWRVKNSNWKIQKKAKFLLTRKQI